ncbi:MAG TPA: NfeD family protein [Pirellulales bacterium]|jgi:membrane-bound ClpP family serine protease|nr:NfeD family protein [Pirellulales bacterium]
MDPIVWAVILLFAGLTLSVIELFLPSGGMIGLMSIVALIGSVWMGFQHGSWTGLGFIAAIIVAVPGILGVAVRLWPRTPMGRRLLLEVPTSDDVLPDNDVRRTLKSLVGKSGIAKTLMMSSGAVQVGDQVIDAVSEGVAIAPGQHVRIVEVHGSRVVVRPIAEGAPPADLADPLSQPIESLGLDPFREPLLGPTGERPLLDNPAGPRDDSGEQRYVGGQ